MKTPMNFENIRRAKNGKFYATNLCEQCVRMETQTGKKQSDLYEIFGVGFCNTPIRANHHKVPEEKNFLQGTSRLVEEFAPGNKSMWR